MVQEYFKTWLLYISTSKWVQTHHDPCLKSCFSNFLQGFPIFLPDVVVKNKKKRFKKIRRDFIYECSLNLNKPITSFQGGNGLSNNRSQLAEREGPPPLMLNLTNNLSTNCWKRLTPESWKNLSKEKLKMKKKNLIGSRTSKSKRIFIDTGCKLMQIKLNIRGLAIGNCRLAADKC